MDFEQEIIRINPELSDFYNSKQYQLSKEIIDYMVKSHLTSEDMARYLKMDYQNYLRIESGDNEIDIGEYEEVIVKLNKRRK